MIKINNELYVQRDKVTFVSVTNNGGVVGLITKPDISCTIADAMTVVDAMGDDLLDLGTGVYICKQNVQYINLDYNEYLVRLTPSLIVKSNAEVFEYLKEYENKGSGGGGGVEVVDELPEVGEEGKIYQLSTNGGLYKFIKGKSAPIPDHFENGAVYKFKENYDDIDLIELFKPYGKPDDILEDSFYTYLIKRNASTIITFSVTDSLFSFLLTPDGNILAFEDESEEPIMYFKNDIYIEETLFAEKDKWLINDSQTGELKPLQSPPYFTFNSDIMTVYDDVPISLMMQLFDFGEAPSKWERIDTVKNVDALPTEGDPELLYKLPSGELYSWVGGSEWIKIGPNITPVTEKYTHNIMIADYSDSGESTNRLGSKIRISLTLITDFVEPFTFESFYNYVGNTTYFTKGFPCNGVFASSGLLSGINWMRVEYNTYLNEWAIVYSAYSFSNLGESMQWLHNEGSIFENRNHLKLIDNVR